MANRTVLSLRQKSIDVKDFKKKKSFDTAKDNTRVIRRRSNKRSKRSCLERNHQNVHDAHLNARHAFTTDLPQTFSFEDLIEKAICSSPLKALNTAEIHTCVAGVYPRLKVCYANLKAEIVATLIFSHRFTRLDEPCENYWIISPKRVSWCCKPETNAQQENICQTSVSLQAIGKQTR